jgi:hypothetical protein
MPASGVALGRERLPAHVPSDGAAGGAPVVLQGDGLSASGEGMTIVGGRLA